MKTRNHTKPLICCSVLRYHIAITKLEAIIRFATKCPAWVQVSYNSPEVFLIYKPKLTIRVCLRNYTHVKQQDVIILICPTFNDGLIKPPWTLGHLWKIEFFHYDDVIMTTIASQITSLTVVYSVVYSGADQRKHQSSASLAFVRGIHRDRWIPRTKGQLRGKCFHLMTSSCIHAVIQIKLC